MGSVSTAVTPQDLLTLAPPQDGRAWELSGGELIVVGNVGARHERIKSRIVTALFEYEQRCNTGEAYAESQFTLAESTARIPDVAFVLNAKAALLPDTNEPIPFAPDLAVEVISDSESATDAETKVSEYLAGGTQEVWQVYPKLQIVRVRTASGIRDFAADEVLTTPALPGFQASVQSFFKRASGL
jgi:Uma2 family endonuclease